jgi:hypothetical protein
VRGELRNARDAAVALHDPAVSRHSRNFEAAFAAALSEPIARLERIIADTERGSSAAPIRCPRPADGSVSVGAKPDAWSRRGGGSETTDYIIMTLLAERTERALFSAESLLNRGQLEAIGARVMSKMLERSEKDGGRDRDRTCDPYHVKVELSICPELRRVSKDYTKVTIGRTSLDHLCLSSTLFAQIW